MLAIKIHGRIRLDTPTPDAVTAAHDIPRDRETLYRDGIVGLKGAFSRDWADAMREDIMTAFWDAIRLPGGAVGRGPRRWDVEIHPEQVRGFVDLVTHPWVVGLCESVLGPDYEVVELGFDTPFQGAKAQPWHRDFPAPPLPGLGRRIATSRGRRRPRSGGG